LYQVHFIEAVVRVGLDDVQNADDVFMIEMSQELDLSQCSQTEHGMIERSDTLDGNSRGSWHMDGGAEEPNERKEEELRLGAAKRELPGPYSTPSFTHQTTP
jgi:hypothetical protein